VSSQVASSADNCFHWTNASEMNFFLLFTHL